MMPTINGVILAVSSSLAASIVTKATLITTLGLMGAWLARQSRAAVRHAVLAASFAALLALPIASILAPPVRIAVAQQPSVPSPHAEAIAPTQPYAPMDVNNGNTSSISRRSLPPLYDLLLVGWFAGAALFLLRMITGLRQVHFLRQFGLPWSPGQSVVERMALDAGISRYVEVLLHESLPAPVTCGVVRPAILLPLDAEAWDADDLNRAIMHELEHVRRGDWLSHCLARAVCAAYWFHPLVWIAWRQLALEAERSCDDAVLRRSEATAYADQLVKLAQRLSTAEKTPAVAMASRSDLSSRVRAVLDGRQQRGRAGTILVALACLTAVVTVVAMSPLRMVAAPQQPATAPSPWQSGERSLRFEVASIKPSDPGRGFGRPLSYTPGRYSGENVPLSAMAWNAYGLKESYQMETTASWMVTKHYDLAAKVPEAATIEQVRVMLQHLLAERFGLVVHHETRLLPGYRLVVAKGGAKLRKSVEAPTIGVYGESIVTKDGVRQFADNARSGVLLTIEEEQLHGRKETMGGLAHYLVMALHTPVIDATGIEGEYDYDLSFEPIVAPLPKGSVIQGVPGADAAAGPAGPPSAPPPGGHPTVFTAIKELGLQLESVKSIPVEVLVLDKANPDPTEN
jgi:uncharacterized protein (TIGR03435 family)